ncbi:hypothetical protein Tc00.1047053504081.370 [Trypanosoma cruzi]|uniref:Uncharacterized protein n=1 Tax=Trypanosoma cruzi (strain CL Brener) TaxID=353153 RepID=Q4E459_TRYCC|nr:hypothetical protein Tc00.1047053504081.370 [Trypanosoma cruzi]EAN99563.1 hypothetical protein Tc00.1047053504081.370 [Trypanosoma cruzi]|eukprot:XP_821414.1 hypothetical protein [Trypanosoma cruzi strain CL Brener]
MPCRNHSHRETGKSVWMCAENTATVIFRVGHRGTVRHASSHTEQRMHPAVQKQEERRMTPRAGNTLTHGGASCSGVAISARDASQRPAVAKSIHAERCANTYFLCAGTAERGAQEGKSIQQEAQLDRRNTCGAASTSTITHGGSTHPSTKTKNKKTKEKKNTAAECGCVCGAAGVCQP